MTVEELLRQRRKVIAPYPLSEMYFKVGAILQWSDNSGCYEYGDKVRMHKDTVENYPHLFRELEWWEERTLDDMVSVKFAKVIEYVGYWRVGDIVPVEDYIINNGKFHSYKLKYNKRHQPKFIIPATEQEFLNFKL